MRLSERVQGVAALARHLVHAIPWAPVVAGAVVAVAAAWIRTRTQCPAGAGARCVPTTTRVEALRLAGLLLAIGSAFVLDDPAEETTAPAPTPRWLLRALRVALVTPVVAAGWFVSVLISKHASAPDPDFPSGAVALEVVALIAVGLAVAGIAAAWVPERRGGMAAGPILLLLGAASILFQGDVGLLFESRRGTPSWEAARPVWATVLALAGGTLLWSSRDPGAARLRR